MNLRPILGAALAFAGLALALPGHSTELPDDVIAAAKKEGKIVLYTSETAEPHRVVTKAFTAKYGIPVDILNLRASELRERIRTEQAAGRFIGDISLNGATTTALQSAEGAFQPHGGIPNNANLKEPFTDDGSRLPGYLRDIGILINTQLVKPGEVKSWHDLLDPKWKGKILSDDYRTLGTGGSTLSVLIDAFGVDFARKLAEQNIVFSTTLAADMQRIARGEYAIHANQGFETVSRLRGLPIKLVVPEEGVSYVRFDLAVLKNAPHPNAARLLMNFYLEPESQTTYANQGNGIVTKNIDTSKVPDDIRPLVEAKLLGTTDPDRQIKHLDIAKELFK